MERQNVSRCVTASPCTTTQHNHKEKNMQTHTLIVFTKNGVGVYKRRFKTLNGAINHYAKRFIATNARRFVDAAQVNSYTVLK